MITGELRSKIDELRGQIRSGESTTRQRQLKAAIAAEPDEREEMR